MQHSKLFIYNTYSFCARFGGLTFLAIYLPFCLACVSNNKQKTFVDYRKAETIKNAININLASSNELEQLPKIGKVLAEKIINHREKYGNFRRPEHLILVKGMSDKKYREIQKLIKVE